MFDRIKTARAPKAPVVLAVYSDEKSLAKGDRSAARDAALASASFRAELGETIAASDGTVILGLGKRADFNAKSARTAGARLVRGLERMKLAKVSLAFAGAFSAKDAGEFAQAMGEAWRSPTGASTCSTARRRSARRVRVRSRSMRAAEPSGPVSSGGCASARA
ncbi:MAG: hypothetical protein ACO31E_09460 [Phycisphaerales bacterium]